MILQISEVNTFGLALLTSDILQRGIGTKNRESVVDALQLTCVEILIERIARYKQDVGWVRRPLCLTYVHEIAILDCTSHRMLRVKVHQ